MRRPKGSPGVPLAELDHRAKVEDCLGRAMPLARAAELIGLLDGLEQLDAGSVKEMVGMLASHEDWRKQDRMRLRWALM